MSPSDVRAAKLAAEIRREWSQVELHHFLRHAYAVKLDANKLAANVTRLERCVAATDPFVEALAAALVDD